MDNSNTVEYTFTANVKDFEKGVKEVQGGIRDVIDTTKDFGTTMSESFYQAVGSMNDLDTKTKALLASITAVEAVFVKDSLASFAQYEDAVYGMATTVGNVGGTIEQAMEGIREATASGLISETDAARAINNLTTYGYSVQEATRLIQELTNVSMAHRNESLSVSEQVEKLTEGIKRGSTQMLKANGLLTTASQAQAIYAASIGKTVDQLSDAEKRQAVYNQVVQAGESTSAVASAYQESYSAATQRLSNSLESLKISFGQVLAPLATWIANAAAWIVQNKELVTGVLTFVGVIAGSGGIIFALSKLIPMIVSAISAFATLNVVTKGVIIGLATVATAMAVSAVTSSTLSGALGGVAENTADASDSMDDFAISTGGAGGAVRDLSKEIERLNRDYLESLKQIEQNHKETINRLTKQIQEANVDYKRAVEERNAEFAVQQAKEERSHQEKVDDIMAQIRFLQRYNNDYNKQKLANLEFALAKENALYKKQTEATKAELELQNENDRIAYEAKRAQYQAELDEELAFMERHREDLKAVQNVILLDEIDMLKRRHEEQIKSYEEQAVTAGAGGANIGNNLMKKMQEAIDANKLDLGTKATELGSVFGDSFAGKAFKIVDEFFMGMVHTVEDIITWIINQFKYVFNKAKENYEYLSQKGSGGGGGWGEAYQPYSGGGFAYGGYTGKGGVNEVAGIVHKGEYVLPQELVDQNTGTPKSLGNTFNIYVEGVFATSAAERRRVADQIVTAINQNNKSRLEASWQ